MMVAVGRFLFRYRNALFPFACLLVLLPGRALFQDPLHAALTGAVFALLGQLVRAGTIGLRYIVRGGRGGRVYADDLVTEGIYSHCRNPMYVGNILIVIGVAIASNSLTTVLVALPLVWFAYSAITAAEEDFLRGKFGAAFEAYCRDVPRWLPRLHGLGDTLSKSQFHWRRLLVKEYGTPFGWIGVLILATLYNLSHEGWTENELRVASLLLQVLAAAAALWLLVWLLKKTHVVVAD
ncbi:MAG TPA: isoprenylcysteine carboxylmethyltransferase family protein [Steroidobacteraceae bacterium]|nr:isoprenylcysteine carboxylmethyltransferase family protein [Steroidobacteraceae bacterium]